MFKKIVVSLFVAALILGGSFNYVQAQNMTVSQLIELFISIGVISSDKASAARTAVGGMSQTSTKLTVDGAYPVTPTDTSCYTFTYDFGIGSYGEPVSMLQKFIISNVPADGTYDEDVASAVVKFQARNNIRQTGYVGPLTRAKLNSLYSCKIKSVGVVPVPSIPVEPRSTKDSVTLLAPNGGESWTQGTTQTIKWQNNNSSVVNCVTSPCPRNPFATYDLKLAPYIEPCSGLVVCPQYMTVAPYTIVKGVSGTSYDWLVGNADTKGGAANGRYTIQVCLSGTDVCDSSDTYLTLVSPVVEPESVTVLSPNGGETMIQGVVFDVKWKTSNTPYGPAINFELYKGSSLVKSFNGYANTGSNTIVLPETIEPGTDYKIAVVYGAVRDFSDNYFTVVSSVVGGYDSCRLDKLDGSNITRGLYTDRTSCLANICDMYGPANLVNGLSSKCVFQGIEIKRYEPVVTSGYHSADTNHDWKISDSELETVTSLYNYKNGTARTGEYSCSVTVASGYQAGSGDRTCVYHSADSNKDWKISLLELTRVIELKNAAGYKVQAGTEDGFAPLYIAAPVIQ